MVQQKVLNDLFAAFPDAIMNRNLEFVADPNSRVNSYFRLDNCKTRMDVAAKLLERLSRNACKSQHFNAEWRNAQVHKYHLDGINQFCGTAFTSEDIGVIYGCLGNGVNHKKTLDFIQSSYDLDILKDMEGQTMTTEEKVFHFVTALGDVYRDEDSRELGAFSKLELFDDVTDDITAMLIAFQCIAQQLTGHDGDLIDFTHFLNKLAVQYIMEGAKRNDG